MSNENTSVETTENETINTETVVATEIKEPKAKRIPAWEAFAAALSAQAQVLGLTVTEQAGYIKVQNPQTKHRLDVPKQAKKVQFAATTLNVLGMPGTHPLEKENGRITCTLDADLETLGGFLQLLASDTGNLPAPKRQAKVVVEETSIPSAE